MVWFDYEVYIPRIESSKTSTFGVLRNFNITLFGYPMLLFSYSYVACSECPCEVWAQVTSAEVRSRLGVVR